MPECRCQKIPNNEKSIRSAAFFDEMNDKTCFFRSSPKIKVCKQNELKNEY